MVVIMNAVNIIKDANWCLEVGDITWEQYNELVAPLRDVEVVQHGWWKHKRGGFWICSVCGFGSEVPGRLSCTGIVRTVAY